MSSSSSRGPEFQLPPLAIGIDLGTSYCSVGVFENQRVTIIDNDFGNGRTPSYVAFTDNERFIGDAAKNSLTSNPMNIIFATLRLIGRKIENPLVQGFNTYLPFEVISDEDGNPKITVEVNGERKSFSPEEICSMLLAKMKTTAEKYLGRPVTDVVVSVPANSSEFQRQAIRVAATIAGLNVLRLIPSPAAAAIGHYFHDRSGRPKFERGEKNVLVFDLGGGTLDVAILTIEDGIYEVKSMASDNHLGGEDFVNRMLTHFMGEFRRKHGKDITTEKGALLRLRNACERAMKTLSSSTMALIEIHALFDGIDFHETITRARFEELNAELFRGALEPVEKCLRDAKMEKSQVHEIILVGGSTRIPKIWELLKQFSNGKHLMQISEEAVAYGSAVYAAVFSDAKSRKVNGGEGGRQSRKRKADGQLQLCIAEGSGSRGSTMNEDAAEDLMVIDLVDIYRPNPLNDVAKDSIAIITKKILQEEIATDFAIVCESGAEIKCHKVFLCAQSGVLHAKIQSGGVGVEAVATNKLEMPDMKEESVKGFLAFLYYRDTTEASKNFAIALELLRAAHLYDIKSLKMAMEEMILAKETSWFGVDDAVRLFVFSRRMENGEDLKMKAVEILKQNISTLEQSDCYQELYKENPESAMDLFKCSLSN